MEAIGRARNLKNQLYKSIPLPLWNVYGSFPLLDPP